MVQFKKVHLQQCVIKQVSFSYVLYLFFTISQDLQNNSLLILIDKPGSSEPENSPIFTLSCLFHQFLTLESSIQNNSYQNTKKLTLKDTLPMEPDKVVNTIKIVNYQKDKYGDYPFIKSTFRSNRKWTEVKNVNQDLDSKEVLVRARINVVRHRGNSCLLVLREGFATIQAMAQKSQTVPKEMIKYIGSVPCESIVDLTGRVKIPEKSIETCTQLVEIQVINFFVVNRAASRLPLQLSDASIKVYHNLSNINQEEQQQKIIKMKVRLDNRVIDLRTQGKQAIFRISSMVCQLYREFLLKNEFIQIHTPKLIASSSEGRGNLFKVKYFDREVCLAQSPQVYKQMCVMSDFQRVFEIGPVFRAENTTHRNMCEFVGLDIEMTIKEHYFQILDLFGQLFSFIFENIAKRCEKQLKIVNQQFQCQPFKCKYPVVKITFEEGLALLRQNGIEWPIEDLNVPTEKMLGELIRKKYDSDFYMMHRYLASTRPFYTTLCEDNPNFTCSYDLFMRGQEILSGGQRIHEPKELEKRAVEFAIDPKTIKDYIQCFKYGAYPHGGGRIGLERVVMLYMGLNDIRNASLFPRDPRRITP